MSHVMVTSDVSLTRGIFINIVSSLFAMWRRARFVLGSWRTNECSPTTRNDPKELENCGKTSPQLGQIKGRRSRTLPAAGPRVTRGPHILHLACVFVSLMAFGFSRARPTAASPFSERGHERRFLPVILSC